MGKTTNSKITQGYKNILQHEDKKAETYLKGKGYRKVKLPVNAMNTHAVDTFAKKHGIKMIDMGDGVRIDSRLTIGNPDFKFSDLWNPKKKFVRKEIKIIEAKKERKFQKGVKRNLREWGRKSPQWEEPKEGVRYKMDTHLKQGTKGISSKHPELGRIRSYYTDTKTGKEITSGTHIRKTGGTRKVVEGYSPKQLDAPIQRDKKNRGLMKKARTKRLKIFNTKKALNAEAKQARRDIRAGKLGTKLRHLITNLKGRPRGNK